MNIYDRYDEDTAILLRSVCKAHKCSISAAKAAIAHQSFKYSDLIWWTYIGREIPVVHWDDTEEKYDSVKVTNWLLNQSPLFMVNAFNNADAAWDGWCMPPVELVEHYSKLL